MLPTILVSSAIALLFVWIVVREVKNRKKGHSCSCGCGGCAMKDLCHKTENKNESAG